MNNSMPGLNFPGRMGLFDFPATAQGSYGRLWWNKVGCFESHESCGLQSKFPWEPEQGRSSRLRNESREFCRRILAERFDEDDFGQGQAAGLERQDSPATDERAFSHGVRDKLTASHIVGHRDPGNDAHADAEQDHVPDRHHAVAFDQDGRLDVVRSQMVTDEVPVVCPAGEGDQGLGLQIPGAVGKRLRPRMGRLHGEDQLVGEERPVFESLIWFRTGRYRDIDVSVENQFNGTVAIGRFDRDGAGWIPAPDLREALGHEDVADRGRSRESDLDLSPVLQALEAGGGG